MARPLWTLALILICIPILATVITAFRVRDSPKTAQEDYKSDLKKLNCDDCDGNELKVAQKQQSVKTESAKRYEELKKATREKLQTASDTYVNFNKHVSDDKVTEVEFRRGEADVKHPIRSETSRSDKDSLGLKLEVKVKRKSNDDEDDDDDDDDDDDENAGAKLKSIRNKITTGKKNTRQNVDIKSDNDDDDDDDGDDDDADDDENGKEDNNRIKMLTPKKIIATSKDNAKEQIKSKSVVSKNDDDDDDDDGDDDDDDDDEEDNDDDNNKSNFNSLLETNANVKTKQGIKQIISSKPKQIIALSYDDDDDDEEDDDESDTHSPIIKGIVQKDILSSKERSMKKQNLESKSIPNTDDIDVDDNKVKAQTKDHKTIPAITRITKLEDKTDVKTIISNQQKETAKLKKDTTDKKLKEDEHEVKKQVKSSAQSTTTAKKEENKEPLKQVEKSSTEKVERQAIKSKLQEQKETKAKDGSKKIEKKPEPESIKKEDKSAKFKKDQKAESDNKKNAEKDYEKEDISSKESFFDSQEMFSKSENHLKHVTDALQRRNLLHSEFEDFYAFFPTFAPNFTRIHNPECRRHGQIVLRQLRGTKLWAFNMLDATAKIPSGLLQGNGIQLGDYDQCLSSRARVQLESGNVVKVQGQYCLARLDVKAEHPDLELPVHLAQAKNLIKSKIDDPGHFVPRFSTLSWGVCVPTTCNPEDVEVVVKDALKHYQHTSGLVVRVKVDQRDCHTIEGGDWWESWLEWPTILTLSLYAVVILLVLIATIQDFFIGGKSVESQDGETDEKDDGFKNDTSDEEETKDTKVKKDGFLAAFSLYRSFEKLIAPGTDDDVACIHGVRGLATIALLIAHKFLPVAVMPYTNRLKITETVSSPLWSWCRAGWVFTDCFLLLSGTLMAHRTDSESSALRRIFARYLRLTPALLAVVLFYAYVWDLISEGPMWGTLVTKNAEVCQEGWWWNLLYVQNYFGFEDMCAPQTHQLALDMQLTITGSLLVWAIQSEIPFTKYLIPALMAVSTYSRYSTVQDHRLTMLAYHGVSVSQLYRTARFSYTSTLHRSTPYLVGLTLGLILRKPNVHGKIMLIIGWLLSLTLWGLVWWASFDAGSTQYRYNATLAAQYASLAPIASSIAIAWVIYTVHNGQCEWLCKLLCCRFLAFISRLSYALYLTQFIVFFTNAAVVRSSSEFTLMSLVDVQELSVVLLTSVVLTLTFVIPMQSLPKLFVCSSKLVMDGETETEKLEDKLDVNEDNGKANDNDIEVPLVRNQHFMAHREVLEEIPEVEIEYESQREKNEGLEEILEEEEEDDEMEERVEEEMIEDEDLEIIAEEVGGEDDWEERRIYQQMRSYSRNDDRDLDEWEWTTNGNERNGAQNYR